MLKSGTTAPDFTLPADDGREISLKALRGKPVVLYFYPKDDTSGCTTQACGFRDGWAEVKKSGALLFGISPDGVVSHQKFKQKYSLPFPLLADTDHTVAAKYGAWGKKSMYGREYEGILRTTFVIDADGIIRTIFPKVKPKGHAAEVLAALQAAV